METEVPFDSANILLDKNPKHPENTIAYLLGWGLTSPNDENSHSPILQEARVPLIPNKKCNGLYTEAGDPGIDDNMICAGGMGHDSDGCQGDSGGPLFIVGTYSPILIGVGSFGTDCASQIYPAVSFLYCYFYYSFFKKQYRFIVESLSIQTGLKIL